MTERKTSRRGLFALFVPERERPAPSFSLDAFYRRRQETGAAEAPLPPMALRQGLPEVPTTDVGVPERSPRHAEEPPLPPLPPELDEPDDEPDDIA